MYNYKSDYLPRDSKGLYESPWKEEFAKYNEKEDSEWIDLALLIYNKIHHDAVWKLIDRMPYLGYEAASIMCANHFAELLKTVFCFEVKQFAPYQLYYYFIQDVGMGVRSPMVLEDALFLFNDFQQQITSAPERFFHLSLNMFNVEGLMIIDSVLDDFYLYVRESLGLFYADVFRSGNDDLDLEKNVKQEGAIVWVMCNDRIIPEIAEDYYDKESNRYPALIFIKKDKRELVREYFEQMKLSKAKQLENK